MYSMTWVPARKGWMKSHRGRSYSVSCRQLGVEPTKEASYQAANAWWQAKEAVIGAEPRPSAPPLDPASTTIRDITGRYSIGDLRNWVLRGGYSGEMAPEFREQRLRRLERDIGPEPAPPERTVGGQVEAWVRLQRSRHVAGKISAGRVDAYERNVAVFRDWIRPGTDIGEINAPKLRDYYAWLCAQVGAARFSEALPRSISRSIRPRNVALPDSGVAEMPAIPEPYRLRDWAGVTRDYLDILLDFEARGEHLPLIGWKETAIGRSRCRASSAGPGSPSRSTFSRHW